MVFSVFHRNILNRTINYYTSRPKYLSIGCYEILRYKKLYPNESKFFLSYYHNNLNKKSSINNLTLFNKFIDYLKNKTNFYKLAEHKNISFELVFYEILQQFIKQVDFFISEYSKANKIITKIKPVCVIFQSFSKQREVLTAYLVILDYSVTLNSALRLRF